MSDLAVSQLLTELIAPGYLPGFLTDPLQVAAGALQDKTIPFTEIHVIYGTDFKGLFGQLTVPYGLIVTMPEGPVVCAIRGTDSTKEWLEDGWAVPEPWPFAGHTHRGFTDLYETLVVGTTKLVDYLRGKSSWVTGHSLGAALANLLAADLGPDCSLAQIFEGPRVGDKAFCTWMDTRVKLVRNVIIGDIVPHLPPEILGYDHAGVEHEWAPNGLLPHSYLPLEEADNLHRLQSVQILLNASSHE